jgi:hypothetical protein
MSATVFGALALLVDCAPASVQDVPAPVDEAFSASWDRTAFRHDLWSDVLAKHVDEAGLVDYEAIGKDVRFLEYLYRLANTRPDRLRDTRARLAFWINAYNALVIQGVLTTLPEKRADWARYNVLELTKKGKGVFAGLRFVVGGRRYTLDEIEKGMLLQRPERVSKDPALYQGAGVETPDPRVHFGLVCAAKGCVKLRREAYEGTRINEQLDDAVRGFVHDPDRAVFDRARRIMRLSQLLDWYQRDFTDPRFSPHADSVGEFLAKYVDDDELARSLSAEPWKTTYIRYDWSLNLQR